VTKDKNFVLPSKKILEDGERNRVCRSRGILFESEEVSHGVSGRDFFSLACHWKGARLDLQTAAEFQSSGERGTEMYLQEHR
jgi:hypothetical protein